MKSRLTIEAPRALCANQLFRAKVFVRPGRALHPGGRIVIAARHVSDLGQAQMDDPLQENYIAVEGGSRSPRWRLDEDLDPHFGDSARHPWNQGIGLVLSEGSVAAGETITVHLGAPDGSGPGFRCQSFAESPFRLRLGLDPDGSGNWETVAEAESPSFEITGARPVAIRCVVPNATRRGDVQVVRIKPEDAYGNVAGEPAGEVSLLLDDTVPVGRVSLKASRCAAARVRLPAEDRWRRITAVSDDGAYFCRSNPFGPTPLDGYHLYWGDLHMMSGLCCATGRPLQLYAYAREAAGLDFAAVASIEVQLSEKDWFEVQEAAREAHDPGEFVTFLAYEWGGTSELGGDHCVYFPSDGGRLVRSRSTGLPAWNSGSGLADRTRDLSEVVAALRDEGVMIVPHCGGRRCNLDFFEPTVMPMIEIHSCHQNFEDLAFDAIQRGIRCGFIADSDDHRGAGGDSHPAARERYFSTHSGLVGVYARELTRAALWEAFFARRVYASNGPRIVIDFRVNGIPMGGEVRVHPREGVHIRFRTWLDGMMDRVELVRGIETVRRFKGTWNQVTDFTGEHSEAAPSRPTPYWIRVIQADGGTAWSSPVWVEPVGL